MGAVLTFEAAASEGVSDVSGQAGADRAVGDHTTLGVEAAGAGAGVDAVLGHAGQGGQAVAVHRALGPAAGVRVSEVLPPAGARTGVAPNGGVCVGAAGVRVAGVTWGWRRCKNNILKNSCIEI